ncbi:MAG: sigma-54 dependent transcriptional regulator [Bacteroidales bacterium]
MVLIIDDDSAVRTSLSLLLRQAGYQTEVSGDPAEAGDLLIRNDLRLVILDLNFSNETTGEEGLSFLQQILVRKPGIPVILITAWGSISLAVQGMKLGAFDFITKPWDNASLLQSIRTALALQSTKPSSGDIKRDVLDKKYDLNGVIGQDPSFLTLLETVGRISRTNAQVLILGESGTGKEVIAEAIHRNSERKNKPFIKVNLGGVPNSLFESEMFGHKKGSFTDASSDREGSFSKADGGSIFLDEIGDLDMNSQVKLLRVLQDKSFQVLGESVSRQVDVRILCATNRDVKKMVERGEFREDLFYRINLITLQLPSLRERRKDIPLLARHFLEEIRRTYGTDAIGLSREAGQWLMEQAFPGNVRELKNLVERTWLLNEKNPIGIRDLEQAVQQVRMPGPKPELPRPGTMTLDEIEHEMIAKAMEQFKGNISKVAKSLGLSRGTLYRRLEKYGIAPENAP